MSYKGKKITIYLSNEQHKELKVFCAKLGLSMSCFINNAIKEKILKQLKEKQWSLK